MVTLLCTVRGCRLPLSRDERRLLCARNHSFDIARSGYVNLLQPQDRRSAQPGDSSEAVAARRRFLDRGLAQPITEAIVAMIQAGAGDALLDVGCGEGHHLGAMAAAHRADAHGTDISLPAIEAAARRYPEAFWVIANADRFLPYADGSFSALTSITARMNAAEFRRVLRGGGELLVALPGADDLIELRQAVLGEATERDRVERTIAEFAPHFSLVQQERVRHVVHLDRTAIEEVMTSSYRGLRARERERVASIGELDVTMSRDLLLFR